MQTAWGAYQLDLATLTVGREIENALANGEDIKTLLKPKKAGVSSEFASLKGQITEKVKIKPDGTW